MGLAAGINFSLRSVALTAESDRYTTTKWTELGVDSRVFDQTPGGSNAPGSSATADVLGHHLLMRL